MTYSLAQQLIDSVSPLPEDKESLKLRFPKAMGLEETFGLELFYNHVLNKHSYDYNKDWPEKKLVIQIKNIPDNKIVVGHFSGIIVGYLTTEVENPNRRWFHFLKPEIPESKRPIFERDKDWWVPSTIETTENYLTNFGFQSNGGYIYIGEKANFPYNPENLINWPEFA